MKKKLIRIAVLALLISLIIPTLTVSAKEPYASYYLAKEFAMKIPAPYEVYTVIDFKTKEDGKLSNPEDIFIADDDMIYVADTGNNRVVVINPVNEDGVYTLNKIIEGTSTYDKGDMSALNQPKGIFVDDDGSIIVADTGNSRLVEYTKYGYFKYSYTTPEGNLLSESFNYMPLKIVKDSRNYIYVANSSDSNGILMLDEDGSFRQYYGANKVSLSVWESIARLLWDREDRKGTIVTLPYSFNNLFASTDGYIYATTTTSTPPQVRKLNAGGTDVVYATTNFSDSRVSSSFGSNNVLQNFCDVTVIDSVTLNDGTKWPVNSMLILDQQYGRIYEYDENGTNLFAFSTIGTGYGQLSLPISLAVDSIGRIYVLNKGNGTITVFKSTDFADSIHIANSLYSQGKYNDAFPQWQKVLDKDSYYTLALQNMGMVYMREEEYNTAYDYFYDAKDAEKASDAFVEIRTNFLRDYFAVIMTVIVIVLVLWIVLINIKQYRRRKYGPPPEKINWFTPIRRFFGRLKGVIRHPIDTFEAIRYENKGSYTDMFVIMILYVILNVGSAYCKSFIFRGGTPLEFIKPLNLALTAILPWFVVCIVNYGVTTIMYGEGRLRDVFIGGAYCHTPFIFLLLPLNLLTNVLTLDEQSLFNLINTLVIVWVGFLVFMCIKSVHGFHPVKAVVVFFITAVGVAVVALLFMIVVGLAQQMFGFIGQFGKELSYLV